MTLCSLSACVCNAGYSGDGTTAGGCLQCAAGTYKDSVGNGACISCVGTNIWSPTSSISINACQCNVGYDGTGAACSACTAGNCLVDELHLSCSPPDMKCPYLDFTFGSQASIRNGSETMLV